MTELMTGSAYFDRTTTRLIATNDGTPVAESFQTRLTAQD